MLNHVLGLLSAREGHFLLESGHHSDVWLDLETLCLEPRRVQPLASELARRLRPLDVQAVCGPLIEGAFVGLMVARELDVQFAYAERFAHPVTDGLFPAGYRIPGILRDAVRGKRVAIVNDVTSAGSAVRGTYTELNACGAEPVVVGTLLLLGTLFSGFAAGHGLLVESLASRSHALWEPAQCPMCAAGIALVDVGGFGNEFSR